MRKWLCLLLTLLLLPIFAQAEEAVLTQGSRGDEVVKLQERLQSLGLLDSHPDGVYGKQTASAVEQAQRLLQSAGYEITTDGIAGSATLSLLYDANAENALLTLRRGSTGNRVKELQNRLIDLGFLKTAADGTYGSRTEQAVLAFQVSLDLKAPDGVASPEVIDTLMSDLSSVLKAPVYFDDNDPLAFSTDYLYAPACILIDAPTGAVLLEHNADQRMYPASTTKIMTLLLALQSVGLDEMITIPESAADIPTDSSLVPVFPGERMTMKDLLYGLIIRSGNDAANAVAELCSGSVTEFVEQMNAMALQFGMQNSHFVNPHGYHHSDHYTTARDLAIAARQGLTNPVFCKIVTCMNYTMQPTAKRDALLLKNTWELFDPVSNFYISGAAGVKSGYTSAAGFCYVGAAQRDGQTLIAVVLGEPTRNRAWIDLRRLFEYGFAL